MKLLQGHGNRNAERLTSLDLDLQGTVFSLVLQWMCFIATLTDAHKGKIPVTSSVLRSFGQLHMCICVCACAHMCLSSNVTIYSTRAVVP